MKRNVLALCCAIFGLALAGSAGAMDHGQMKGGMDMDPMGQEIHESTVDGYHLTYRLIDMKQKMEMMKGMKGMSMKGMDMSQMKSHHLMVFVTGPDGKPIEDGKVGYKVEGPGGEQKTMAMGMKGGFGADVDVAKPGTYEIKTKAVMGDKTLTDEFKYDVK